MTDNRASGRSARPEPGDAVAVLGTGIMGSAMARNLVAAGLRTTVWDRSSPATGAAGRRRSGGGRVGGGGGP